MEKYVKLQNLRSNCRTCLSLLEDQQHQMSSLPTGLMNILRKIGLNIPEMEQYPDAMCGQCYDILKAFHDFETKVETSTNYLEKLFEEATVEESKNKDTQDKQEQDPLTDFESVLVKIEIEVASNSPAEQQNISEVNTLPATVEICEKDIEQDREDSPYSSKIVNESRKIVCKFGCGRKFRHTHYAAAHYRFKHKTLEEPKTDQKTLTAVRDELHSKACSICFKSFNSISRLRSHMATHNDVRPFQCEICNRGFNMKSRLNRHKREIHEDNPPEINCKYGCGKTFTRHESAMNHYRIKHILPEKGIVPKTNTYVCEDCGKTFKTMHNLKEHSYVHRPVTERPFQCEQCQKRFVSKRPYEIHLLRHAGIKNFECNICGLKTTTHNELRNHMNHHTKARQVTCPICSKTYTNPDNLRRHTLIVHQGVKNYKCRFCDEKFGKPDHLKHHEMRHTGERPHKCQICERGFIQLVALKAHMKTHYKLAKSSDKVS